DIIFLHQRFEYLIAEMGSTITHYRSWRPVPGKNMGFHKIYNDSSIVSTSCLRLDPFRYIINSKENVIVSKGRRKRTHEINPPHVKYFTYKNRIKWHLISMS